MVGKLVAFVLLVVAHIASAQQEGDPCSCGPTPAPTAPPPTLAPTNSSTSSTSPPTAVPTNASMAAPTVAPTNAPTAAATDAQTAPPTVAPTNDPTAAPTAVPTDAPTAPTPMPTEAPTAPTASPTDAPTAPTSAPTAARRLQQEQEGRVNSAGQCVCTSELNFTVTVQTTEANLTKLEANLQFMTAQKQFAVKLLLGETANMAMVGGEDNVEVVLRNASSNGRRLSAMYNIDVTYILKLTDQQQQTAVDLGPPTAARAKELFASVMQENSVGTLVTVEEAAFEQVLVAMQEELSRRGVTLSPTASPTAAPTVAAIPAPTPDTATNQTNPTPPPTPPPPVDETSAASTSKHVSCTFATLVAVVLFSRQ